jgi:hypothetical protein
MGVELDLLSLRIECRLKISENMLLSRVFETKAEGSNMRLQNIT